MVSRRRPALMATVALATALALTGAGCGGGDDAGGGLSKSAKSRRSLPSCGSYDAPDGELPAEDRTMRDCFLAAFQAGRQAEVTITAKTLEGDAITTIYRVLGPNDLELFVDASADKFAAAETSHQRCQSVAEAGNALTAGGCTTVA